VKADECVGDVTQPSHYCVPLASVLGRCQLRSADANKLSTSRTLTSTLGPRSLSVSGPASWNALPARLRHPDLTLGPFHQLLKTTLFSFVTLPRAFLRHFCVKRELYRSVERFCVQMKQ